MVPTRASASSNTPSHSKSTILSPLSVTDTTVRERPPSTVRRVPGRHFLPGFTSTSQRNAEMRLKSSTSTLPPCSVCAYMRAGSTFVLFTTSTSPAFKKSFILRNIVCVTLPSALL